MVLIHGKEYKTVAERVNEFRSDEVFKHLGIITEIIRWDGDDCVIRAEVRDGDKVLATGLAHEVRGSSNINSTSHVENCETSAIGRALANLGFAGTEYASANEVSNAIVQQQVNEATDKLKALCKALLSHHEEVMEIKAGISACDEHGLQEASRAWYSMPDDIKTALWIAESKGGVFSASERQTMQTKEFREAYYGGEE